MPFTRRVRCLLLSIGLLCGPLPIALAEEPKPIPLFDGKTLDGWEGNLKVFRVEDGAIVGGSMKEKVARNEFLCTKKEYGDFELKFKAKLIGKGDNAGVQVRSQRIPNHHEMKGYQADMGSAFGRSCWGSLYDESRRNKMLAEGDKEGVAKATKKNEWNDVTVRCEGPRIRIWLNGYQTIDYTEKDTSIPLTGIIGLQIHGGDPSEAWYKEIAIVELGKTK